MSWRGPMILIALGANLPSPVGPSGATLAAALASLEKRDVKIRAVSPFYQSIAWPDAGDPPFVNAVAEIGTNLQPFALMGLLHDVETDFGRKRSVPNAPRTLDIDLIDYDGRIEAGPPVLPHPRLAQRGFVLVPLRDIAPGWRHSVTGASAAELLDRLGDPGEMRRLPP
jgi:2-amino-4-hydroxy-6-hydroxymethyldihydropteridine diphosphokinase